MSSEACRWRIPGPFKHELVAIITHQQTKRHLETSQKRLASWRQTKARSLRGLTDRLPQEIVI